MEYGAAYVPTVKYILKKVEGIVLHLPTLQCGHEAWSLREGRIVRLRSLHNELVLCALCISIMLFAAVPPSTSLTLFHRSKILDIVSHHHNQILPWAQSRRLVRRKGASWSLNWPSGANLLAHLQLKCIFYVPLWLLCTCLSLFLGRVSTRLD